MGFPTIHFPTTTAEFFFLFFLLPIARRRRRAECRYGYRGLETCTRAADRYSTNASRHTAIASGSDNGNTGGHRESPLPGSEAFALPMRAEDDARQVPHDAETPSQFQDTRPLSSRAKRMERYRVSTRVCDRNGANPFAVVVRHRRQEREGRSLRIVGVAPKERVWHSCCEVSGVTSGASAVSSDATGRGTLCTSGQLCDKLSVRTRIFQAGGRRRLESNRVTRKGSRGR